MRSWSGSSTSAHRNIGIGTAALILEVPSARRMAEAEPMASTIALRTRVAPAPRPKILTRVRRLTGAARMTTVRTHIFVEDAFLNERRNNYLRALLEMY